MCIEKWDAAYDKGIKGDKSSNEKNENWQFDDFTLDKYMEAVPHRSKDSPKAPVL